MRSFAVIFVCALALTMTLPGVAAAKDKDESGTTVIAPSKHDVSPPLASIAPKSESTDAAKPKKEKPLRGFPQVTAGAVDTAVQSSVSTAAPATTSAFDGIGQGFSGPAGTFTVQYAPPDTNGAVGPNHFVQTVNVSFAVFSKTGGVLYGPAAINTLWAGFGGLCQADNDGDPTVIYDQLADRWVIQQFAVSGANGGSVPYLECIAVSTSGDPMGTYNRYAYASSRFPDYPKLGVWPDAYYLSTNDFNGNNSFAGASTWAFDRAKMLVGDPGATAQVAHLSSLYGGLLPSSLDGQMPPPAGSPDYFVSLGTSTSLFLWKFHVDFANIANSSVTGPTSIPVAGFTELCNGGTCIPQAGTTQRLDSLADRLMYRLAYRNFGDHQSLLVTHSVAPSTGGGGIRWYEIRNPGGTPTVYQQSTYAPDTRYRWMASAAMDNVGNIGVGYSLSGATMNPAIAYTGRAVSDPLNTLQGETLLIQGTGSQLPTLSRWGDYSSMFVDPSDDCTFWYTTEYLTANGTWNWHTRIGTFKFANCPAVAPPTVTAVSPTSGPTAGGTPIAITGTNFAAGATVSVGGTPATGVSVLSATQLNATTPAHAAGPADVVVTIGGQSSATNPGDRFTYVVPPPTVSAVSPTSGTTAGGTPITITGTGFAAGATATVGGSAATGVSVVSATQINATTPAHPAGVADVIVTVSGQSSAANPGDEFTYVVPPPTVTAVNPSSGPTAGGTTITITGTSFDTGPATVSVGDSPATGVSVVSATQINATTPAHSAGLADVVVTIGGQSSATNAGDQFTYLAPAPTVTAIDPTSGPTAGGTAITITGTSFDTGPATVTVGGTGATGVSVVSATQITATTPAHATGLADVVVTIGGQSSAANAGDQFTYLAPPPPTVTAVNPASGPTQGGTAITITGTNFDGTATVAIGGNAATGVSVVSATQINATTPPHPAGVADVVVTVSGQSSAANPSDQFTYLAPPPPTVSGVSPTSGPTAGGTPITITGTNFDTGAATVTVGGSVATGVSVVSATQINATTPAHAAGVADIVVIAGGQPSAANPGDQFTYLVPAPTVTALTPTSGTTAGGTAITITGTSFDATATVTVGGSAATGVSVVSATQISATTPARPAGVADVIVTVSGQSSAANPGDRFTYVAPPAASSVTPTSGSTLGGASVTLTGTSFQSGATVTFGGNTLTSVTVVNATTITGTTPSHAAGAVDVVVTNPDAQSGTCTGCYSYVATAPTISNVQVSVAPNKRSATITWSTDIPADSQVEYGTTTAYGAFSPLDGTLVTSHSVTLTGLTRFTTYHYRVYSRNSVGELTISGDFTFTTR